MQYVIPDWTLDQIYIYSYVQDIIDTIREIRICILDNKIESVLHFSNITVELWLCRRMWATHTEQFKGKVFNVCNLFPNGSVN